MGYATVKARVKPHHIRRIEELQAQTGMNQSEVLRALIENAAIVQRPVLGATLVQPPHQPTTTPEATPCP